MSITAPIRRSAATNPIRYGFKHTSVKRTDEPWSADAAAAHTAADDGSPGISCVPVGATPSWPPATDRASACTDTSMPKPRSIRSVWSRVGSGSWTVVTPRACKPASRIALLIWALGTSGVHGIAARSAPSISIGARPSCDTMRAPIAVRGSITRRMGRRDSDASPVIVV